MKIHFCKYQGTGNDFVLIDNRNKTVSLNNKQVAYLCDRHFGIGADGLMLLEQADGYDFKMVYYNSDGNESTMCGNGGRCITAFAHKLGLIKDTAKFIAIDGPHQAAINADNTISLGMKDVDGITDNGSYAVLNTGSPHYVKRVKDVDDIDVVDEGCAVRYSEEYEEEGINVNFMHNENGTLWVRTYERGVEDETLSCGTGVTASAIASVQQKTGSFSIPVQTPGGKLSVSFEKDTAASAKNVVLTGPADFVFEGDINL